MIRAVIIEDEDFAVQRLRMILEEQEEPIRVIATLTGIRQAVKWLSTHDADLIFLDINLADGNAFKIFEQIEIRTPIIFTTAYHEYALRAFEQHSIDYLLKPVSREKLRNSLAKLRALQNKPDTDQNFRDLKSLLQTMLAPLPAKRFMVQLGNKVRIVELSEVAYFQAEAKITFLYDRNGRRYPVESSLKQLEEQVPAADFFRVNRQYLVRRDAILELQYFSASRMKVYLHPAVAEDVVVARDKISVFKSWLKGGA